jgi:YgiT-type zinc finger domain-containing protein
MEKDVMAKTRKCPECGAEMKSEIRDHQFAESGLENVWLKGVTVHVCPNGHERLIIPALAQVHRALALAIVETGHRLTGPEVKYLRKYLGRSNKDFARLMGVSESQASRWANGEEMGRPAEHLLRVLVHYGRKPESYLVEEAGAAPLDEPLDYLEKVVERKELAEAPGAKAESRIALKRRSSGWQAEEVTL